MAGETKLHLCVRVPTSLRRRLNRISKSKLKSPSETAREALLEYVERRERELKEAA
jgi:predicted transcriptional regulator